MAGLEGLGVNRQKAKYSGFVSIREGRLLKVDGFSNIIRSWEGGQQALPSSNPRSYDSRLSQLFYKKPYQEERSKKLRSLMGLLEDDNDDRQPTDGLDWGGC